MKKQRWAPFLFAIFVKRYILCFRLLIVGNNVFCLCPPPKILRSYIHSRRPPNVSIAWRYSVYPNIFRSAKRKTLKVKWTKLSRLSNVKMATEIFYILSRFTDIYLDNYLKEINQSMAFTIRKLE